MAEGEVCGGWQETLAIDDNGWEEVERWLSVVEPWLSNGLGKADIRPGRKLRGSQFTLMMEKKKPCTLELHGRKNRDGFAPCGGITRFKFKGFAPRGTSQPATSAPVSMSSKGDGWMREVKGAMRDT